VISCKKEKVLPPVESPMSYISDELKAWGLFMPGSYWIYHDTITGHYDSVYVSSVDHYMTSYGADRKHEMIRVNFNSNYGFTGYTLDPDGFINGNNRIKTFYVETALIPYSGIGVNRVLPTYMVSGNTFTNVRYMVYSVWETVRSGGFSVWEENYWKRNVGVIKRKARLQYYGGYTQHLELVRYHVIQ
jgi:hypothetical protein